MVAGERVHQRGGLVDEGRVRVLAERCHRWTACGRREESKIPQLNFTQDAGSDLEAVHGHATFVPRHWLAAGYIDRHWKLVVRVRLPSPAPIGRQPAAVQAVEGDDCG